MGFKVSEGNKNLIKAKKEGIEAIVNSLFATKTPKQFIKSRPGPGGTTLHYVEVGYVVSVLNNAFGPFWEWRITDKQVGDDQIWVQGELTVKDKDSFSITKTGFGGSAIKKSRESGKPVSIANDLKAASSDALKKAASLFGIASDLFYKEMDILEEAPGIVNEVEDGNNFVKQQLISKYFAVSLQKGFEAEEAKTKIKEAFGVEHMAELSKEQLGLGIKAMDVKDDVIEEIEPTSYINTEQDCLNEDCMKGEGELLRAKRVGEALFCSDECKTAYTNKGV